MAIVKGTNSYVELAEATAYFTDRLDVDAWDTASDIRKGQALVTAALYLNDMKWVGTIANESQTLAFPRNGVYFDPTMGTDIVLDSTKVPTRIINANYELAYHLLNNDGLLDDTGQVDELSIGSIKLKKVDAPNSLPSSVYRIIKPLLINGGARMWWKAN